MNSKYFVGGKLECEKGNAVFIRYLADLKSMLFNVKKMLEEEKIDISKEYLMDKYGLFSPKVYDISHVINETFLGSLKDQTIEVYLKYENLFQELSDERVSDLTGYNKEVSVNKLRLFLMQEIRDIEAILS